MNDVNEFENHLRIDPDARRIARGAIAYRLLQDYASRPIEDSVFMTIAAAHVLRNVARRVSRSRRTWQDARARALGDLLGEETLMFLGERVIEPFIQAVGGVPLLSDTEGTLRHLARSPNPPGRVATVVGSRVSTVITVAPDKAAPNGLGVWALFEQTLVANGATDEARERLRASWRRHARRQRVRLDGRVVRVLCLRKEVMLFVLTELGAREAWVEESHRERLGGYSKDARNELTKLFN